MGLDSVELVMAFEEEFGIEFSDEEAEQIVTVGDARDAILRKLTDRAQNPDTVDAGEVWRRVHRIVVEQLGVKPERVTPGAAFIDDLGVD